MAAGEPAAPAAGPMRIGEGIRRPRKIKDVKAVYPQGALPGELRGVVYIEATIDAGGKVIAAKILRSVPGLDQAAVDAVMQWEYEPTRIDQVAVAVIITVTVNFMVY